MASQYGAIRVFRVEEVTSVSLSERSFHRRSETSALIVDSDFINALPHFHFISNVIHTFRERSPEPSDQSKRS